MIRVPFDPDTLEEPLKSEWAAWQKKAETATAAAIEAWAAWKENGAAVPFKCVFKEEVWGELKAWLVKNVFHDKCAYCETRLVRDNYHAEHYRPKGRVTMRIAGQAGFPACKVKDENGAEIEHPGYFWLAYHWMNLLPSCNDCNTALGKRDQFPTLGSHAYVRRIKPAQVKKLARAPLSAPRHTGLYFLQPCDLDALEKPALLHPYFDDPRSHLRFGEKGTVAPCEGSKKGALSIEVYDLANDRLRVARQMSQEEARLRLALALLDAIRESGAEPLGTRVRQAAGYDDPTAQYSAAVRDFIDLEIAALKNDL
jgi:hypothetical protein